MSSDIIAESQTQLMVSRLMRGDADPADQQMALASVLDAVSKLNIRFDSMQGQLWKPEDLVKKIDERCREFQNDCPTMKYLKEQGIVPVRETPKSLKTSLLSLLTSESFRSFLLILLLVWTVIYSTQGKEGAKTVRDSAFSTFGAGHTEVK